MAVVDIRRPQAASVSAARRTARNEKWARVGLLTPGGLLLIGVFLVPLGIMVWYVFTDPGPGLGNLAWYLGDPVQRTVLLRTFTTALTVTVICIVLGYPYACAMVAVGPRVRAVLTLLVVVPFWTSLMVRTFAWIILLQDSGPVYGALVAVGLGHIHLIRTNLGVVIGMSQILLPFFVLPLYAVMRNIDRRLVLASSSLGAKPFVSFFRVWLPLSLPGIAAGGLITFISSLGFYVTPALLGSPSNALISQQIFTQVSSLLQWGRGGAMGAVLLVITLIILGVLAAIIRFLTRRQNGGDPS
ncbi:MAG: transporter permease [Mycobacterium sp.]|nr:transporter permease [Mycobacterium sp.]